MTAGQLLTLIGAMVPLSAVMPYVAKFLVDAVKARFSDKPLTPVVVQVSEKRSSSSDSRMRALSDETAAKIESLHAALARENPNTGANVLLENVSKTNEILTRQTSILDQQTTVLQEQTQLLRMIAEGKRPLPGATRY